MKKIKILTITLLIILITMIAFFGIYGQVQNRMENKVKDYSYAMDINGSRVVRLKVNTNTKEVKMFYCMLTRQTKTYIQRPIKIGISIYIF